MEIKKYEEKMVKQKVEVGKEIFCDVCGNKITSHFWKLCTHHSDWERDSIDSYSYYDLCSKECVQHEFDMYMDESNNSCNSKEFELEHCNYTEYKKED